VPWVFPLRQLPGPTGTKNMPWPPSRSNGRMGRPRRARRPSVATPLVASSPDAFQGLRLSNRGRFFGFVCTLARVMLQSAGNPGPHGELAFPQESAHGTGSQRRWRVNPTLGTRAGRSAHAPRSWPGRPSGGLKARHPALRTAQHPISTYVSGGSSRPGYHLPARRPLRR